MRRAARVLTDCRIVVLLNHAGPDSQLELVVPGARVPTILGNPAYLPQANPAARPRRLSGPATGWYGGGHAIPTPRPPPKPAPPPTRKRGTQRFRPTR